MMKAHSPSPKSVLREQNAPGFWGSPRALFGAGILSLLAIVPEGWTQYPFAPQPPALIGPTAGASLRNAAAATLTQAGIVRNTANAWGRRANSGNYRVDQFQQDYANMQSQYLTLRQQFNWMNSIAQQAGGARVYNAMAELDAGLNIIAELFAFLENQFNAGTLDRQTIVRTCRSFEDSVREWERELRKNSSRMGLVW